MGNDQVTKIQSEINTALELLKTEGDPAKRRELLIAIRMLMIALEKRVG
jgi:hypothetical protein